MGQLIYTKNYGLIEVDRSWQVCGKQDAEGNQILQGGHIALLANGAYCHISGLPIESEEEVKAILCTKDMKGVLDEALEWFAHRHDLDHPALPRIMFDANGWPFFEDGVPVEKEEDLYQCLKPGPILTAAIVGLSKRREVMQVAKAAERSELPAKPAMPPPHEVATPFPLKKTPGRKPKLPRDAKGRILPKTQAVPPPQAAQATT